MKYRYHHFHLICSDLEQMIKFFCDTLGAELITRRKYGTADGAMLNLAGMTISLRVSREDEEIAGDSTKSRYGYDHFGLEVDNIDEIYKELSGKGFQFTVTPTDVGDVRIAFFKGPDGITFEILQSLE